jgi:hypothetical protein
MLSILRFIALVCSEYRHFFTRLGKLASSVLGTFASLILALLSR